MSCDTNRSQTDGTRSDSFGELEALREENARLKALLARHGIAWEEPRVDEAFPAAGTSIDCRGVQPRGGIGL